MRDDLLGELVPNSRVAGALSGEVLFNGSALELLLNPDGEPLSACVALARELVQKLIEVDQKARTLAAVELLDSYNENWRMYGRVDPDGRMVEVTDQELTDRQFKSRLRLSSLTVSGSGTCALGYGDDHMFAGHSVFVTSFNRTAFTDTDVQLFG